MYFITIHIIVVYSVLSQTETQYDRFRCDTFEAAYFSNHTLLNIAHENMSVNVYSHPRSFRVCVFVYAFYISFYRINAQLFIRHRVFSACLSDWLTVYIVVHRIHTLAHTPTQPKNVDSFSIVVFGFAYCLCGFVEWIHHPFGVIRERNPRKTCRCLSFFR